MALVEGVRLSSLYPPPPPNWAAVEEDPIGPGGGPPLPIGSMPTFMAVDGDRYPAAKNRYTYTLLSNVVQTHSFSRWTTFKGATSVHKPLGCKGRISPALMVIHFSQPPPSLLMDHEACLPARWMVRSAWGVKTAERSC